MWAKEVAGTIQQCMCKQYNVTVGNDSGGS